MLTIGWNIHWYCHWIVPVQLNSFNWCWAKALSTWTNTRIPTKAPKKDPTAPPGHQPSNIHKLWQTVDNWDSNQSSNQESNCLPQQAPTITATMAPTVLDLWDSFETKLSECMVSVHPIRAEVKKLKKAIKTSLCWLLCIIPGTDHTRWARSLMADDEWTTFQQDIIKIAAAANPGRQVSASPDHPDIANPGMFTIQDNWTNRRISREKTNCE